MTDTAKFEVIYGVEDASMNYLPNLPLTEGLNNYYGWYDNDNQIEADKIYYMATAHAKNGQWGSWEVSKIKGEKGEPGRNGQDANILTIDLSNDLDQIFVDDKNVVSETTVITTIAEIWIGNEQQDISTCVVEVNNKKVSSKFPLGVTKTRICP